MPASPTSTTPPRASVDAAPGIRRRRPGTGFAYRDARNQAIRDARTLARIRSLAVPPAWTEVWICRDPNGHIQAVGRDARGRKQYRYHPRWRAVRDGTKYERMLAFAAALPNIRATVTRDLARPNLDRDKVLTHAIEQVAASLGNTPTVCRKCYIHPAVLDAFEAGVTATASLTTRPLQPYKALRLPERRAVALLLYWQTTAKRRQLAAQPEASLARNPRKAA